MNNMSQKDALVLALKLAITAPSENKSQTCSEMAKQFAVGLSELEVASAKREALEQLKSD